MQSKQKSSRLLAFVLLLTMTSFFSCSKDGNSDAEADDAFIEFTISGTTYRYNNCAIVKGIASGGYNRYVISGQQGNTLNQNAIQIEVTPNVPGAELQPGELSTSNTFIRFYYTDGTGRSFSSAGTSPLPSMQVSGITSRKVNVSSFNAKLTDGTGTQTMTGSLSARWTQ